MTPEEIINLIVHVCAVIIVNANSSESLLLERLRTNRNRAIFVSTAIHIAVRMTPKKQDVVDALKLQFKLTPQELANAIKPNNCIPDADFVLLVEREVQRLESATE
jgi:hypothetical protein